MRPRRFQIRSVAKIVHHHRSDMIQINRHCECPRCRGRCNIVSRRRTASALLLKVERDRCRRGASASERESCVADRRSGSDESIGVGGPLCTTSWSAATLCYGPSVISRTPSSPLACGAAPTLMFVFVAPADEFTFDSGPLLRHLHFAREASQGNVYWLTALLTPCQTTSFSAISAGGGMVRGGSARLAPSTTSVATSISPSV